MTFQVKVEIQLVLQKQQKKAMLAPIVTKDMKLFPSTKIPPSVRNVRSRAQSLDHIQQLQNSGR